MAGHKGRLFVYENGDLLYIEDSGLRIPTPDRPAVRTWGTGHLGTGQLDGLLRLLRSGEFAALNDGYMYDGNPSSDLWYTLVVSLPDLAKGVKAGSYLSPDGGETYPGMPHPLDEILRGTAERYREPCEGGCHGEDPWLGRATELTMSQQDRRR